MPGVFDMDQAIVHCSADTPSAGHLGKLFQGGAKAILLDDHRAAWIWKRMIESPSPSSSLASEILSPKADFLFRIARNHIDRNLSAGDMLRFTPGGIGHIARKILFRRKENGAYETLPSHFSGDTVPQDLLDTGWDLMSDILRSTFPAHRPPPAYKVSLEVLKYPDSYEEIESIESLLRDSSGKWARLGLAVDTWKAQAAGLFDVKFIRDCTAFASLAPGLGKILGTMNGWMVPMSHKSVPNGFSIVGAPHCDGGKILTALLSERGTLSTELHTGQQWQTLPMSSRTLAILPSKQMDPQLGIPPTLHRILIKDRLNGVPAKPNITLSLTASLNG